MTLILVLWFSSYFNSKTPPPVWMFTTSSNWKSWVYNFLHFIFRILTSFMLVCPSYLSPEIKTIPVIFLTCLSYMIYLYCFVSFFQFTNLLKMIYSFLFPLSHPFSKPYYCLTRLLYIYSWLLYLQFPSFSHA